MAFAQRITLTLKKITIASSEWFSMSDFEILEAGINKTVILHKLILHICIFFDTENNKIQQAECLELEQQFVDEV